MISTTVERRRTRARRVLLSLTTILCSGLAVPALAQGVAPAPVRSSVDANGVDLFLGTFNVTSTPLSLGSGDTALSYARLNKGNGWTDNLIATLYLNGSTMIVALGGTSDSFTVSGSTYTATEGNGATLTLISGIYTYTRADGSIVHFSAYMPTLYNNYANGGRVTDIVDPSGKKLTFAYASTSYCSHSKEGSDGQMCIGYATEYRIATVSNSFGYQITYNYITDSVDPSDPYATDLGDWETSTGVSGTNLAAASGAVTLSENNSVTHSGSTSSFTVTDPMGRVTSYRAPSSGLGVAGITRPGSASEDVTINYTSGRVTSIVTAAGTVSYASSDAGSVRTVTVTDPLSHATIYTFDIPSQRMTSKTDALGHTTSLQYDGNARVTRITKPEGNYTQITYDTRGNVTERRKVAKSGSGLADIVTSASFPTTCTNTATCNEPTATFDARGNETDYTYDATTGLVTSVTAPAPTAGAIRPQTRYSYTSLQAYYSNGTSIVASGQPVTLLTGTSTCQTTASCTGTADEVVGSISYGPQTAGVGNNLLPFSVSSGAGNGSLTATTAYAYDAVGNLTAVDGPLAGSADTTTYRYDADREQLGVISPDPDGSGPMKQRAVRTTYNPHGIAIKTEVGTVNSTSDADWAAFTSLQQKTITLDVADRPVVTTVTAGGTTYRVSQQSYDAAGRPECAAVRMNSATWGSLPPSACTLGTTGSYGPDRITKTTYDAANRATQIQTAYGTSDQANEATETYNNNGTVATLTDAQGNATSYIYDGFDRLSQTFYPVTTAGAGTSSTTDYQQLTYDAAGNVTSRRLRDGNSINYAYDADGRLTYKDLPIGEPDVAYTYDNLGKLTTATQAGGNFVGVAYDALGRATAQSSPLGVIGIGYDLTGRRTRLSWPDGFYVNYDHLVTGEVSAIRENGATSGVGVLAAYAYDDRGHRTSLTRGNGTSTSYGYDNVSRLALLGLDLDGSGATNDLTLGFSYSPADQIVGTTRSNNVYAWGGAVNRNDASSVNGLNQSTSVGTGSIGYDGKGNLNSTGSSSYTYSSENLLVTGPSSVSLAYDPTLRLYRETGASSTAQFQYDGRTMIGEYDASGTMQKRYVFGPGGDEPLVEYDRSGSTYVRVWLHADERGSIVAQSNDSGTTTAINSYDEYGVPASGNVGRFQYTGQAWLPTLGLYYYKARMYSSRLGRFMQTDPIGYGAGMNWYGYVGGDPINQIDPSGTDALTDAIDRDTKETLERIFDGANDVVVTGQRGTPTPTTSLAPGGTPYIPGSITPNLGQFDGSPDVVVTAKKLCSRPPDHVTLDARFVAANAIKGAAFVLTGEISDAATGRVVYFRSSLKAGSSYGLGVGAYSINADIKGGFDILDGGFELNYTTTGGVYGVNLSTGYISNDSGSLGQSVNTSDYAASPSSMVLKFDKPIVTKIDYGDCS